MYPTIEDIERIIQLGIKRNDFYAYVLSCLDRTIDEEAESHCFVRLNTKKPTWTLVVNPLLFENLLKDYPSVDKKELLYAILVHEFFHLARDHFERSIEYEDIYKMLDINIAADLAINCTMPPSEKNTLRKIGGLFPDQFGLPVSLSMEEYLEKLKKNTNQNGQIHYDKEGFMNDESVNNKEREKICKIPKRQKSELQKHPDIAISIKDIEQNKNADTASKSKAKDDSLKMPSKNMPSSATAGLKADLKKMIENLKKFGLDVESGRGFGSRDFGWLLDWIYTDVNISWKKLLKNSMIGDIRTREWYRSFRRTHPRSGSGILLKGKYPYKMEKILILLDTSGSMGEEDYNEFFGVLRSMKKDQLEVYVSQWDYGELHMEPKPLAEYLNNESAEIRGGGGTDMMEGVLYVHEHYPDFKRIVVVTDGGTPYFSEANPSPVPLIWLITEKYGGFKDADGTVIFLKQNRKQNIQ